MPWAIERFDFSDFDLIISSSHCVAKGIRKGPKAFHMSYIHAPMRYMWDRFDEYFSPARSGLMTRAGAWLFRPYLQYWDRKSSKRVDHFLANSKFIADQIKLYYGRDAEIVHPFCEAEEFTQPRSPNESYLIVTALVPYKRIDLAIDAFNKTGKRLIIVGDGPEKEKLMKKASDNIRFLGALKRKALADAYAKCRALIFPGIEDFGIVPIEAMAAGMPVIALGAGGALETVTPETGLFFKEATQESLNQAIDEFEKKSFDEAACRRRGREFNRKRFQREFMEALRRHIPAKLWENVQSKTASF
jgi:glycosyltransferase involved in cell wall biosynthesis